MANHTDKSKVKADAAISLTVEQRGELNNLIESWRNEKGLVVASLVDAGDGIKVTFKLMPTELGNQILQIVDDFYVKGENDVNS